MKNILRILVMAGTLLLGSWSQAQNGAGNGGDPLRNLFEQAQVSAPQMVAPILPCSFRPDVPASVKDWILKNQAAYIQDLRLTQLKWVVDLQGTCAYTALTSGANLYLSYNECRASMRSLEDAIFTVLHESVHHFNVTDESFADSVARTILYGTIPMSSCPLQGSVFDPNYCQGPKMTDAEALTRFQPAATTALLGNYQWTAHSRSCQILTGCAAWENTGILAAYGGSTTGMIPVRQIEGSLGIQNGNSLFLKLKGITDSSAVAAWLIVGLANFDMTQNTQYVQYDTNNYTSAAYAPPQKVLTNHCLWFKSNSTFDTGNGSHREVETVIFGNH